MKNRWQTQDFDFSQFLHIKTGFAKSLQAIAAAKPDFECLVVVEKTGTVTKSYRSLLEDSHAIAAKLNALPPGPMVTVGYNTYAHVVHILGALFAGRTLCPVPPSNNVAYMIKRLESFNEPLVFKDPRLPNELPGFEFIIPQTNASSGTGRIQPPESALKSDFINVFTSGSTGLIKRVIQSERAVLSNIEALIRHHELHHESVIGTALPISHVNALEFSLFSALLSGSRLILFETFNPMEIAEVCREQNVTLLSTMAPQLKVFADAPGVLAEHFSSLRYFVSAATALPRQTAERIFRQFGKQVVLGYGLSEAVNFSCTLPTGLSESEYRELMIDSAIPSIGIELWGNEVTIRKSDGTNCLENETGEIWIRGYNVMEGYANTSDQPFQDGWLRTGDLGQFRIFKGQKYFFIVGREKDMIKRNGETVSLREIDDSVASLGLEGLDAIAVPFQNTFVGEDVGLLCRLSQIHATDWSNLLVMGLGKLLPASHQPKVVLLTDETLRTESGKPLRFQHQSKFSRFEEMLLPTRPKLIIAKTDH